jgi:indole-3-glycerol phosphate synthase / phosphoribosylanthranilate isomerase
MSKLDPILAQKRIDVAARKKAFPKLTPAPCDSPNAFLRALKRSKGDPARFILEAKKSSPSQGVLREALDANTVVRAYEGVADAISVVTDGPFFGGSLAFLSELAERTKTPLLCKDFIVDPYQVREARMHGASAILIMLSVLDDATALRCLEDAASLGMDALVEVHDGSELSRALALPAAIIGVNNRDFRDLSVDLAVIERLAPSVPRDRILICESGIEGASDVRRIAPLVDGFLVGSSLMRAPDLYIAARSLVFGVVKVCGLTRMEDITLLASLGASLGGLIFAKSPRNVSRQSAEVLAAQSVLPLVGVFQDVKQSEIGQIVECADALSLFAVQLHGSESSDFIRTLRAALPAHIEIIKAMAVPSDIAATEKYLDDAPDATRLLFDTRTAGPEQGQERSSSGGTGTVFPWDTVRSHPRLAGALVAGGITPYNAKAARKLGSYGIDLSSGVEESPGKKSEAKLRTLFSELREHGR